MSSQIQIAPPDLKSVDQKALAVANFLRYHPLLKQRDGFLNGQRKQFFRVKRALRALQSPDYIKAAKKNPNLPQSIASTQEAREVFRHMPLNRMAFNVEKVETQQALSLGEKPAPGVPVLKISPNQAFDDDSYYVWFYEPVKWTTYLYGTGLLAVIFGVVLFPLWPVKMRIGVWYLSMVVLGFLGCFFVLAIVRLILFCITAVAWSRSLWVFPNLFEDVGFLDSFVPFYAWSDQIESLQKKRLEGLQKMKRRQQLKKEKRAKKQGTAGKSAAAAGGLNAIPVGANGATPNQPPPGSIKVQLSPEQNALLKQKVEDIKNKTAVIRNAILNSPNRPKNQEELTRLDQKLTEGMQKEVQGELGKIVQEAMKNQPQAVSGAAGVSTGKSTAIEQEVAPISRGRAVTLEEVKDDNE